MDGQSLATVDTITTAPQYSAMEILQRQRAEQQQPGGAAAPAGPPSPQDKQALKKEKKLEKKGVQTKFSGQIPMDLGLDRRMTITASAKVDGDAGAMVQFDVIVPPVTSLQLHFDQNCWPDCVSVCCTHEERLSSIFLTTCVVVSVTGCLPPAHEVPAL